jgi:hypothetical protein
VSLRFFEVVLLHALARAPGSVLTTWLALEKLEKSMDDQGKA